MKKETKPLKQDRAAREQQMCRRIKDAAFKLMAEKGIDGVSMREIAEKVHVTKPVLYYYFKDKESLCLAIIRECKQKFDDLLKNSLAQNEPVTHVLGQLLERHLEFFQDDPRNSKFVINMIAYILSNKTKPLAGEECEDALQELFARAARRGEVAEKGLPELESLVRALHLQIMLCAYVQTYRQDVLPKHKEIIYTQAFVNRLAQIIVLGINEYYKGKKK